MEKILNFEDFSKREEEVQSESANVEKMLEEISESELVEIYSQYEFITEEEKEFKVTEPVLSGDTITLKINDQKYKFVSTPESDDIKEIFRKFQKMMGFAKAGGKALAWLHKKLGKGQKIS